MSTPPTTSSRPLCVDLDGTLIKTDTFAQALLLLVRTKPLKLFEIPGWARKGLASWKHKVAKEVELDPAVLPVHSGFLEFLHQEKAAGRKLILATAADQSVANRVADYFGFFSEVIASDGEINRKAGYKRDALVSRFGTGGFDYAGNATDDLLVWAAANRTIVVNPSASVRHALRGNEALVFEDRPPTWKAWLKALRVHQWLKNVLIFLPMILAHELTTPVLYVQAVIAFFAFSFLASAIYVVNDLMDLHADQHHPRKCRRPFAAGNLSLLAAVESVPGLVVLSFLLAQCLPASFSFILLGYLTITTCYSWRLKQLALFDVLTLAVLYTVRILAGTAAYGVETSSWLIAFSLALFLSLALVKRYAELRETLLAHPEKIGARGRGYHADHLPWLLWGGIVSGAASSVVLGLYITSDKVVQFYKTPAALWILCPLVLYWIGRIWHLAANGVLKDDPLEFAAHDRQTWALGLGGAVILILGSIL